MPGVVTRYDLQLASLWVAGSIIVVLRHTEGGVSWEPRGSLFLIALALFTMGVVGIPLHRMRKKEQAATVPQAASDHTWRELGARVALSVTIVVIPLAFINIAVAIVALAVGAGVIAVSLRWHVRKSRQRGVPDSDAGGVGICEPWSSPSLSTMRWPWPSQNCERTPACVWNDQASIRSSARGRESA